MTVNQKNCFRSSKVAELRLSDSRPTQRHKSVVRCSTADSSGMDSGSKDGLGIPHFRGISRSQGNVPEEESTEGTESVWDQSEKVDLESGQSRKKTFREMVSTASQKLQNYLDNLENEVEENEVDNSWVRWQGVIKEVEEKYNILEALQVPYFTAVAFVVRFFF